MWPVILTTYNLPLWLCMKESNLMLSMLIPVPKSPGKDIDVFLRPLVEELKTLWSKRVRMRDAATETYFTIKVMLLWTINDYPARSYLFGWGGQGYLPCPTCNKDTPSTRVLGKITYAGHRRFLPKNHHWRNDKKFNGMDDTTDPTETFNSANILDQLARLPQKIPVKHPDFRLIGVKRKRDVTVELNWSKRSIFYELEYWLDIQLKHNLDVMHIEKNVCESFMGTLLMNNKSKDTLKAIKDFKKLGIRKELCDIRKELWRSLNNRKGELLKASIPDNSFKNLVPEHRNYSSIEGVKTRIVWDQNDYVYSRANISSGFFDLMIHLVIHFPKEAIQGGPVYIRWMYPFERYMKKLKNYVRNKAKAEGSIAKGYVAYEALTFCSMYLEDMDTRFNRPDRNEDTPIFDVPVTSHELSVFESVCSLIDTEPLSKMTESNKKQYIANVKVYGIIFFKLYTNDIYIHVDAYVTIVRPLQVSITTKFLNCLQPEWSKYVTMVRQNQIGDTVSYDQLYDSLVQFEPHVQVSKAKRDARNHDPLALIAYSNASSSQSHDVLLLTYSSQTILCQHPSSVVIMKKEFISGVTRGF
ncbi:uncharacterized protein Tco_0499933 [Tanacetum coccineum]